MPCYLNLRPVVMTVMTLSFEVSTSPDEATAEQAAAFDRAGGPQLVRRAGPGRVVVPARLTLVRVTW